MLMRTRRQQRGIVAVVVTLAILSLLVMAGLAIDTGHLVLNKSRLQTTVDAAALFGAAVLADGMRRKSPMRTRQKTESPARVRKTACQPNLDPT